MTKADIIAKTLAEIGGVDNEPAEKEEETRSWYEYVRDVVIPELQRTLPDGEIVTCEELGLGEKCCDICHGVHFHYELCVLELPDGRTGWVCCAVRSILFPKTEVGESETAKLFDPLLCDDSDSTSGDDSRRGDEVRGSPSD